MFKKLVVIITALIICISSSMVVFAGNTEGSGAAGSPVYNSIVKSSEQKVEADNNDSKDTTENQRETALSSTAAEGTEKKAEDAEQKSQDAEKKAEDPDAEVKKVINEALISGDITDNGQFIMNINNPENIDVITNTYSKKLNISGNTEYDDLVVLLARFNRASGIYEIMDLPDGDESIQVLSGYFSIELDLELGENKLLLISYRSTEEAEAMIQYNVITTNFYKETIPQKIVRSTIELGEAVLEFFTGKSK